MSRLAALIRRLFRCRPRLRGAVVGLRICPHCASDKVVPVLWDVHDDEHWWMRLRCGECDQRREVVVADEEAGRFDDELRRAQAKLAFAVARLERERMIAEADLLRVALERDLIHPGDFQ
jgi:hypothetical protein